MLLCIYIYAIMYIYIYVIMYIYIYVMKHVCRVLIAVSECKNHYLTNKSTDTNLHGSLSFHLDKENILIEMP